MRGANVLLLMASQAMLAAASAPCDAGALKSDGNNLLLSPMGASLNPQAWLSLMRTFRAKCREEIGYNGSIYEDARLQWTQRNWVSPQMHPYDRTFYNETLHSYTVQTYLADVRARYGGVDSILIWPTYTNIGCVWPVA